MSTPTTTLPPLTAATTGEIWSEALCALVECAREAEDAGDRAWDDGNTKAAIRHWTAAAHYRAAAGQPATPIRWQVQPRPATAQTTDTTAPKGGAR